MPFAQQYTRKTNNRLNYNVCRQTATLHHLILMISEFADLQSDSLGSGPDLRDTEIKIYLNKFKIHELNPKQYYKFATVIQKYKN